MATFNDLLAALKGVSESTRLRIVGILLGGELTVSELTEILEQSQPRVSRHLRLLTEAGIVERHQEGSWVFYRLVDHPLVDLVKAQLPRGDRQVFQDLGRLDALRRSQRERAERYFNDIAPQWDSVRGHYALERQVEERLLELVDGRRFLHHVDLGTGTGRMLQLFAPRTRSALGIDNSREMLSVARTHLADERFVHCQARYGDIRRPDVDDGSSDLVTLHHVLHFLENPSAVVEQAARILSPEGLLVVVDFAPHGNERLREESAHRRLGFDRAEMAGYLEDAGLRLERTVALEDARTAGADPLDVLIWVGVRPGDATAPGLTH
jgi:ubiquinone/menaquinone biosynthesis C-methylase UbiE